MELQKLIYTVEDGIAVVTMNYLKNLNAIDEQMADELMYVVDAAEKDPSVKVLVIKGSQKAFSAGGDIGYFYQLIQAGGEVNMDGLISKVGAVADGLKRMSKMVVTSVCGAAAGAGKTPCVSCSKSTCSLWGCLTSSSPAGTRRWISALPAPRRWPPFPSRWSRRFPRLSPGTV